MSREAFEAYISDPLDKVKSVNGRYHNRSTQIAWLAWQAAQADAYKRAVKACNRLTVALDNAGQLYLREAPASQCADAIRALAKEAT